MHESVQLRLQADVPVGCYLSGGLDSCAVLGIASLYSSQPVAAYTLSFDKVLYDEEPIAREMAQKAGAKYTPIAVTSENLASAFSEALWHAEVPFMNSHGVAKFMLSEAVRASGYKVVLTGEGSDEIFAGYPHFRRDLILFQSDAQAAEQAQLLEQLLKGNEVSRGLLLPSEEESGNNTVDTALGFTPSYMSSHRQMGTVLNNLLSPDTNARYAKRDPMRVFLNSIDVTGQLQNRDPVHQSLYLWSKTFLPNYILTVLGDRMEMAHSVEGRLPFLDHKVVEAVVKMPVKYKIKGMTEKYILREAAKNVLTDTVYGRQKQPFLAPPVASQTDGPLFELMQDTLRGQKFAGVPFYQRQKIIALLDELPHMEPDSRAVIDPLLMMTMSFTLLQEQLL